MPCEGCQCEILFACILFIKNGNKNNSIDAGIHDRHSLCTLSFKETLHRCFFFVSCQISDVVSMSSNINTYMLMAYIPQVQQILNFSSRPWNNSLWRILVSFLFYHIPSMWYPSLTALKTLKRQYKVPFRRK